MHKRSITNGILLLSVVILLFGSGYKLGEYNTLRTTIQRSNFNVLNTTPDKKSRQNIDFSLFWTVWDKLEEKYVDQKKLDPQKMYYGAIKGMVASLEDPYTFFLTTEENKKSKEGLEGKFEGIGAQLGMVSGKLIVVSPMKDSPAIRAGIRAGDFITRINDEPTTGMDVSIAVGKIRGDKGTTVKLELERAGKKITVEVVRDTIRVESIEMRLDEKSSSCSASCQPVAYLKINQFGDTTVTEWQDKVAQIRQAWSNKSISGLVLDLRDNPGGYLESSVYLAGEFLERGKVVVKQESTTYENRTYTVDRQGGLTDIPMVVLINKGSASASEILAGALRDHGRATLIGEKSFGKGSVQEPIDLGKGTGLHVTVAKWILPKGEWINHKGIEPDVTTELKLDSTNTLTRETDTQLERAVQELVESR